MSSMIDDITGQLEDRVFPYQHRGLLVSLEEYIQVFRRMLHVFRSNDVNLLACSQELSLLIEILPISKNLSMHISGVIDSDGIDIASQSILKLRLSEYERTVLQLHQAIDDHNFVFSMHQIANEIADKAERLKRLF